MDSIRKSSHLLYKLQTTSDPSLRAMAPDEGPLLFKGCFTELSKEVHPFRVGKGKPCFADLAGV